MRLISISVWGDSRIYWQGAIANARLRYSVYPGWSMRVYTDAENPFTAQLREMDCQVVVVQNLGGMHGLFWRFFPVSEPGIDAVIIRDADSRINSREAAAVAAWLNSGKPAHVMRDHPFHYRWPIIGGMWGARGEVIADIETKINDWGKWTKRLDDMRFQQAVIWPLIANECLQHSSGHSPWGGQPFPDHDPCESDYVGQRFFADGSKEVVVIPASFLATQASQRVANARPGRTDWPGKTLLNLKRRYWAARKKLLQIVGRQKPSHLRPLRQSPADESDLRAWIGYADHLMRAKFFAEGARASERALTIDPSNVAAERIGIHARLFASDWTRRARDEQRVKDGLNAGQQIIHPYPHRAMSDSEVEHLQLARVFSKQFPSIAPLWRGETYNHRKIRLAYLSTDFRNHVISEVMAGCLERHDRSCFEITAISLGPDDGSKLRRRVLSAFDRVVDAQSLPDSETARIIHDLKIGIAIDLMGYSRPSHILAHRPAPVQVNFLGYPGTMAASFMDYIIADPALIPPQNRMYYTEKVAYLPDSYMPQDRQNCVSEAPSRRAAGLPKNGFVFAAQSQTHRITPEMFGIWMRLLQSRSDGVLWLRAAVPEAALNLRNAAAQCGVSPDRLIFAPQMRTSAQHLARLQLADIFLDTMPYNAHTMAADAIWAGVPVVTCAGSTFSSRVAAGMLRAVGIPELATSSLAEYEQLAKRLATDATQLRSIRMRLRSNRKTHPLFDTLRFTRNLERAYSTMWQNAVSGKAPETFSVEIN